MITSSDDLAAAFHDVVKDYRSGVLRRRSLRAVDGVSFRVGRGEVVGLAGPNRAGKTTLVKMLLTLCRPTRGQVERLGRPADERRTLARVGYVHERPSFPTYLSAAQVLDYYATLAGVEPADRRRRIPRWLERVGLADRRGEPVGRFSKGMTQRLALAQALLNEPELLVLDEPYEGLDADGRRLVGEILDERRGLGRSTLIVSHAQAYLDAACHRIVRLDRGRVVAEEVATGGPAGAEPAAPHHRPDSRPLDAARLPRPHGQPFPNDRNTGAPR